MMIKVKNKTVKLIAVAIIELLRPYKDLVLTIAADNRKILLFVIPTDAPQSSIHITTYR